MYKFETRKHGRKEILSFTRLETEHFAKDIGMDFDSDIEHRWFLNQALSSPLPANWKKERDPQGETRYFNTYTHSVSLKHPDVYKFRKAFTLLSDSLEETSYEYQRAVFQNLVNSISHIESQNSSIFTFYENLLANMDDFLESIEYQMADPKEMIQMADLLGIRTDFSSMWLARLLLVLPLPPKWTLQKGLYQNPETGLPQAGHPAIPYLKTLVKQKNTKNFAMEFLSKDYVKYKIDLRLLANGLDYVISKDYKNNEHKENFLEHFWLLNGIKVNFNSEIHMLGAAVSFLDKMRLEFKDWEFRFTGEGYWYNIKSKQAKRQIPFKTQAFEHFQMFRDRSIADAKPYIISYTQRHPLYEIFGKNMFEQCRETAIHLIMVKFEDKETVYPVPEYIKKAFTMISEEKVLNLLFAIPFRIDEPECFSRKEEVDFSSSRSFVVDKTLHRTITISDSMNTELKTNSYLRSKSIYKQECEEVSDSSVSDDSDEITLEEASQNYNEINEKIQKEEKIGFMKAILKHVEEENNAPKTSLKVLRDRISPKRTLTNIKMPDLIKEISDEDSSGQISDDDPSGQIEDSENEENFEEPFFMVSPIHMNNKKLGNHYQFDIFRTDSFDDYFNENPLDYEYSPRDGNTEFTSDFLYQKLTDRDNTSGLNQQITETVKGKINEKKDAGNTAAPNQQKEDISARLAEIKVGENIAYDGIERKNIVTENSGEDTDLYLQDKNKISDENLTKSETTENLKQENERRGSNLITETVENKSIEVYKRNEEHETPGLISQSIEQKPLNYFKEDGGEEIPILPAEITNEEYERNCSTKTNVMRPNLIIDIIEIEPGEIDIPESKEGPSIPYDQYIQKEKTDNTTKSLNKDNPFEKKDSSLIEDQFSDLVSNESYQSMHDEAIEIENDSPGKRFNQNSLKNTIPQFSNNQSEDKSKSTKMASSLLDNINAISNNELNRKTDKRNEKPITEGILSHIKFSNFEDKRSEKLDSISKKSENSDFSSYQREKHGRNQNQTFSLLKLNSLTKTTAQMNRLEKSNTSEKARVEPDTSKKDCQFLEEYQPLDSDCKTKKNIHFLETDQNNKADKKTKSSIKLKKGYSKDEELKFSRNSNFTSRDFELPLENPISANKNIMEYKNKKSALSHRTSYHTPNHKMKSHDLISKNEADVVENPPTVAKKPSEKLRKTKLFTQKLEFHSNNKSPQPVLAKASSFLTIKANKFEQKFPPLTNSSKAFPRTSTQTPREEILSIERTENTGDFEYYAERIGHPHSNINFMKYTKYIDRIQPHIVVLMGLRLGLQVSSKPYQSLEADLLWIPYLQLAIKHPLISNKSPAILCKWPIGRHPGDYYFMKLLKYSRKHARTADNWLPFRSMLNESYDYNFYTHEKRNLVANKTRKFSRLSEKAYKT